MKTIFQILTMLILCVNVLHAQTICDCKVNYSKNTLILTGAVTYSAKQMLSSAPTKHTYQVQGAFVNKSNCRLTILGIKVGNTGLNPRIVLEAGSSDFAFSKDVITTKAGVPKNADGIQIIKVTVTYLLNKKRCTQDFELQYFDEVNN
jgi:hypothetical protein